jgi:GDP-L-fucose synthase
MLKTDKIYVAGHRGLVGSAIVRRLETDGFSNIITTTSDQVDLTIQAQTYDFITHEEPDYIILAAARVGGIKANSTEKSEFLYQNTMISNNVTNAAFALHKIGKLKKFIFLGSSCIYPGNCPQPMNERELLSGPFHETDEGYALAKVVGIKLVQYLRRQFGFPGISVMPPNLYGPNDHFDLNRCHVLGALVRRFVDAKESGDDQVTLWGTGEARREFLHVDDMVEALIFLEQNYDSEEIINSGSGIDYSIKELAYYISERVGFKGNIIWDTTMPNGPLRKLLDNSKINALGWRPRTSLIPTGVDEMINIYKAVRDSYVEITTKS